MPERLFLESFSVPLVANSFQSNSIIHFDVSGYFPVLFSFLCPVNVTELNYVYKTHYLRSYESNMKQVALPVTSMLLQNKFSYYVIWCETSVLKSSIMHKQAQLATYSMLVSCLTYSSRIKMEAICSSEMSVDYQRITHNQQTTNQLSNSLELSPSESTSCSATQEFPNIFTESVRSLPCSQQPATGLYPELD
jgi:hypothetical protein